MFIPENIEEYIFSFSEKEPLLLSQLNKETALKYANAHHMISGAYQGRLLSMISKISKPNRILEIGTFTGYSALCLAEGLSFNGKLYTIDRDKDAQDLAKLYFDKSEYNSKIISFLGNAKEILESINDKFDLVFIDADKKSYLDYFYKILPMMNKNGIILVDNLLWKGKVINEEKDKITQSIHQFNQTIAIESKVEVVLLPIRDGLSIIRVNK